MNKVLPVGAGGFVGSILRYWFSGVVQQWNQSALLPVGTLAVNLVGCLVIGFLSQLADMRGVFAAETRALVFVGVLGGFMTFSAFGDERMNLMRDGETPPALLNVSAHLVFGLAAIWLGRNAAYWIWRYECLNRSGIIAQIRNLIAKDTKRHMAFSWCPSCPL
jgi:fluoride exporter